MTDVRAVIFDLDGTLVGHAGSAPIKTAVLTNGTTETAKFAAVGLLGRVGPIFTAEELGAAKPAPSTYLAVCSRLGVDPRCVLHVGDLHDLDVLAPRSAGLQAVHLDRSDAGPHNEPDRITSLTQPPERLRRV